MSSNPRNVDTDAGIPAKEDQGNAHPTGTGAKATRQVEADRAATDNKQAGREGQAKGSHIHGRGG